MIVLSHESFTQYPDTTPTEVQFLQRFVTPSDDANMKNSVRFWAF